MKTTGLYFIKDCVSGVAVSGILQVMNDLVAVRGFIEFCKNDKVVPIENSLFKIAELDEDNRIVKAFDEPVVICRGDVAEAFYKEAVANLTNED